MCLGSKPDVPPIKVAASPPKLADSAVVSARESATNRAAAATGFAGTRLTSGLGGTGVGKTKKLSGAA